MNFGLPNTPSIDYPQPLNAMLEIMQWYQPKIIFKQSVPTYLSQTLEHCLA